MFARLLLSLIRLYQRTLSRLILRVAGPVCRFEPSCSRYAIACIEGHGALRGSLLSVKRLCKCHPLHPGGYDPPPPPSRAHSARARTAGPSSAPLSSPHDAAAGPSAGPRAHALSTESGS